MSKRLHFFLQHLVKFLRIVISDVNPRWSTLLFLRTNLRSEEKDNQCPSFQRILLFNRDLGMKQAKTVHNRHNLPLRYVLKTSLSPPGGNVGTNNTPRTVMSRSARYHEGVYLDLAANLNCDSAQCNQGQEVLPPPNKAVGYNISFCPPPPVRN